MTLALSGTGALTLPTDSTLLADPAQFDNTLKLASTAFVRKALGSLPGDPSLLATNTTLTTEQAGNLFVVSGAYQITLPSLASSANGASYHFLFAAVGGSVKGNASESILGGLLGGNTYGTYQGEKVSVTKRNNAWYVSGGGFGSDAFPFLSGSNGYQQLPSGWIIQWCNGAITAGAGSAHITMPLTFPYALVAYSFGTANSGTWLNGQSASTTGIDVFARTVSAGNIVVPGVQVGYTSIFIGY